MKLFKEQRPVAVDPVGCGCTECGIGEYVPLERAGAATMARLVVGDIANHTGYESAEEVLAAWKVN